MEFYAAGADLCSADNSVNGLKFGKKIYFEDVGTTGTGTGGAQVKSGNAGGGGGSGSGSSSRLAPLTPAKKGKSGGQPPRCQVQGCEVDLSNAKGYYSKHKVCGLHSKTSKVIVAGLEQRFCQQCSRFHLLPDFDQGKRSCRKRLAEHNERRRKPPTGNIMSPCYENGSNSSASRGGGFLMDFSACSNLRGGASWPNNRQPEYGSRNHPSGAGNYLQQAWQNNSSNTPSDLILHGSSARTTVVFPGECFTRVSETIHAPSLLSNQTWDSRERSSTLGVNNLLNPAGTQMVQPFGTHGVPISHFSSPSWSFKSDAAGSSCNEVPSSLGFGPMAHNPQNYHNPGMLDLSPQSNRPQYLDIDYSRGYDSHLQHINWSL